MPVFCRSVSPLTTRRIGIEGAINIPVSICGVVVNPGDLVVGDDDGIFVVSPELAEEYGEKAIAKQNGEPALKNALITGNDFLILMGVINILEYDCQMFL